MPRADWQFSSAETARQYRRPFGYWSCSLDEAERAYDTTRREYLAVRWAVLLLRLYLKVCQLTAITDHEALKGVLSSTDLTSKPARWWLQLSKLEFDDMHNAGIKPQASDTLSWLSTTGKDQMLIKDDIPILCIIPSNNPKRKWLVLAICRIMTWMMTICASDYGSTSHCDFKRTLTWWTNYGAGLHIEQAKDLYCREASCSVGLPGHTHSYNWNQFLTRIAPTDGAFQNVVPNSLQVCLLYRSYYPHMAVYRDERRRYDSM